MRQLLSKLLAGGLSAAVVLLWYPQFFPSDSVESWLIRGVVWTLSFELMLLAFAPFEEAIWETRAGRRMYRFLRARVRRDGCARSQLRGRSLLAGAALTVPVVLLLLAPPQVVVDNKSEAAPAVTHVTEVKRIVKVERTSAPASPVAASSSRPDSGSSPARRSAGTVNYEGDRASSRKPARRGGSAGADTPSAAGDSTPETESDTSAETGSDVADAPTSEGGAGSDATPVAGTDAAPVSTAPRIHVEA